MCFCDPTKKTPVCENCPEDKKEKFKNNPIPEVTADEILNAINNYSEYKLSLIKERFNNDYFRLLSISDHLRECSLLYDKYKLKEISIDELNKELTDLYILLNISINKNIELYNSRIDKFIDKIKDENK